MKFLKPILFGLAIVATIFFLIKIVGTALGPNLLEEEYKNEEYGFIMNHSKDWKTDQRNGTIIFLKDPLETNALLTQVYTENDCAIMLNILRNSQDQSVEEYFSTARDVDSIQLGENNFARTISADTGQITSYAIKNRAGQILNFSAINLNISACREEVESIMVTMTLL